MRKLHTTAAIRPTTAAGRPVLWLVLLWFVSLSTAARAGGTQTLDPVEIKGSGGLVGAADSASEGTVTQQQIATRAWLRPGEVLETVPGLITTQHSGDGKANQFFLRGFNLDHGTDFATSVLGMPINLPTHAHGQGYTDLNFLIPELVSAVRYRKGPYSVQQGDFAAAGSASIDYVRTLAAPFFELGLGENGFRRALAAAAPRVGAGTLLIAGEGFQNDGPWEVQQNFSKKNAVLRYSQGDARDGFDIALLAYDAKWTATDQVAQRAIDSGLIGRFGSLDPTSGGDTKRTSLSAQWARRDDAQATRASVYAVDYQLNLFSNFTYALDDPVNGDQFEQADRRTILGGKLERSWFTNWGQRAVEWTAGTVLRQDRIDTVGLYLTRARERLTTIRDDNVRQTSVAAYGEANVTWTPWLRTIAGVRADRYSFDVTSDTPENSGTASDQIVTPKFTAILGPWSKTEAYLSYGHGFHSNDARGTVINVNPDPRDPEFGQPVSRVPALVRARGSELGLRTTTVPNLQSALALWRLELASELVFVGDAGTTEASRPSRRQGVEWASYWTPTPALTVDLDIALSRARFRDDAPEGKQIPCAIERTASLGVSYDGGIAGSGASSGQPWFGGLRLRYFGPRPLIEDDSVRSSSSTLVNARVGYRFSRQVELLVDALNLFDRKVNDIEYFYTSRLRNEVDPVDDIHLHPGEPRTVRLTLRVNF